MKLKLLQGFAFLSISLALFACGNNSSNNGPAQPPPPPGPVVVLQPQQALSSQYGEWVNIDGVAYFVPISSQLYQGWQPYQNGYWSYDTTGGDRSGWTWVSNDSWGWMTEHYGIWRHHDQHGWIWLPFDDHHYSPSVVTWFDQGNYIGWYPYFKDYSYVQAGGFDDGYWERFPSYPAVRVAFASSGSFAYNYGFVVVNREHVTQTNIANYVITEPNVVMNVVQQSHSEVNLRAGHVGPIPGGSAEHAYNFVQGPAGSVKAPMGPSTSKRLDNGSTVIVPFHSNSTPPNVRPGGIPHGRGGEEHGGFSVGHEAGRDGRDSGHEVAPGGHEAGRDGRDGGHEPARQKMGEEPKAQVLPAFVRGGGAGARGRPVKTRATPAPQQQQTGHDESAKKP